MGWGDDALGGVLAGGEVTTGGRLVACGRVAFTRAGWAVEVVGAGLRGAFCIPLGLFMAAAGAGAVRAATRVPGCEAVTIASITRFETPPWTN
jgi:hypothetical protein